MLKKQLGFFGVFSIAAGAMISSGLFVLPGLAFAKAGPAMILSYAIAGILMIPTLLAKAELATAMPKSGGSYFFIERSLGPLVGTVAGLANWLSIALKASFAMIGIGALAAFFFPEGPSWTIKVVAVVSCLFFMGMNTVSVKGTGRLQIGLVMVLIGIMVLYIVKSFPLVDGNHYIPFLQKGMQSVFSVAGMVFISFGGLTKVVDVAEEVRDGRKNLPLGMFFAFAVVNLLYVLVVFVTVGVVEPALLEGAHMPVAIGGGAVMGLAGTVLITVAAMLAFATTANAGVMSASRTPLAMSRDGLMPGILSRTSGKFSTPVFSLALTGIFMMVVMTTLSLDNLVKTASTIMILMFILMNVSVIIMRHSGMQTYRPRFIAPFNPYLPIVTIIVYIFLIFEMGTVPLVLTGVFCLVAIVWYLFYVQRKIDRQSAIVYMVKNIVSRNIQRTGLEEELKQIALQRDHISPDRFDSLVKDCSILDIDHSINAQQLFEAAANELAPRLNMQAEDIYHLLIEREKESNTIVKPGLAIPHIIVEGEHVFHVLLVRCNEGVVFSQLQEPVKTAFILIGSADERNYHLRALMTVAHIVSEEGFEDRWFRAKNPEQLRDIVLLSERDRSR